MNNYMEKEEPKKDNTSVSNDLVTNEYPENIPKKSKKAFYLIGIIILLLLAFGIYLFIKTNLNPLKEDWGNTYYVHLKNNKESIPDKEANPKLKFIDVSDIDNPVMIMNYNKDTDNYTNIYYIDNNKVNTIVFEENTNIEYLYNIEKETYEYYIHITKENEDDYKSLKNQIKESKEQANIETNPDYTFKSNSDLSFDDTFITPETNNDDYISLDNSTDKYLKETLEKLINAYIPEDKLLTKEEKEAIASKAAELKEKISALLTDNMFKLLKGVWLTKDDNNTLTIHVNNKEFIFGWFASEAVIKGPMEDMKYDKTKELFTFKVNGEEVEIDVSNISNNVIKMEPYTFEYYAKDMDEAYQLMFN